MAKPPITEEQKEFTGARAQDEIENSRDRERKEIAASSSPSTLETPQGGLPAKKSLTIKWNEGLIDRMIGARKIRLAGRRFRQGPLFSRRNVIEVFIYATILALIVRGFLFESFHIPTMSMAPTLLEGDYVFVSKISYGFHIPFTSITLKPSAPNLGDIVVFRAKATGDFHMKRIVGLPGDTIQVDRGRMTRNGLRVEVSTPEDQRWNDQGLVVYNEHVTNAAMSPILLPVHGQVPSSPQVEIKEGEVFVMGDNRAHSEDSRQFGPIAISSLVGKAERIWMSVEREPSWKIRWNRIGELP